MFIVFLHLSTISVWIINFDGAKKKIGMKKNTYITIANGT